jgi:DNA-directed RNA polymerase subunit RPC12/RpoP
VSTAKEDDKMNSSLYYRENSKNLGSAHSQDASGDLGRSRPLGETKMMMAKCAKCGRLFDSSFTVDDFQRLSVEQMESGTLHMCVYCGHVGLYLIRDYVED